MVSLKPIGTATVRRRTRRLVSKIPGIRTLSRKNCPPGQILRKGYTRHYSTAIRVRGYTVKRDTGTAYRVYPKNKNMYVESRCVKNMGLPGKETRSIKAFGPLRKGELAKHGYSFRATESQRHAALTKAVEEYTSLGVFRKLDAVAKLTLRTVPRAAKVFAADRTWIAETFGPLKAT
jgi:hypothetical protein